MTKIEIAKILSIPWSKIETKVWEQFDKEFINRCIKKKSNIYSSLPEYLKKDYSLALCAVNEDYRNIEYVPNELKNNKQFIIECVKNVNKDFLRKEWKEVLIKFKEDIKFFECLVYAQPIIYTIAPDEVLKNIQLTKKIISEEKQRREIHHNISFYSCYYPEEFNNKNIKLIEELIDFDLDSFPYYHIKNISIELILKAFSYALNNDKISYDEPFLSNLNRLFGFADKFVSFTIQNPELWNYYIDYIIENQIYNQTEKFDKFIFIINRVHDSKDSIVKKLEEKLNHIITKEQKQYLFNKLSPKEIKETNIDWFLKSIMSEDNSDFFPIIQSIDRHMESLESNEFAFFQALRKEHLENKENSIFSKFFKGLSFYNHKGVIEDFSDAYKDYSKEDKGDIDELFRNEIINNADIIFTYEQYNTNFLSIYKNTYFFFDDEGQMSELGYNLFKFPLYVFDPFDEDDNEYLDYEEYRKFCNQFGFDFNLNNYLYKENIEEDEPKNISTETQIKYNILNEFISILTNKFNDDENFKKIFNMENCYEVNASPKWSNIFKVFKFNGREFYVSKEGLTYEIIDNIYIPYAHDFISIPYFWYHEMVISEEQFSYYKDWIDSTHFSISKYFLSPNDRFWNKSLDVFR